MDIYDEFLAIVDELSQHGIDYAVCGSIALAIHGLPRFTRDIDLLIRPEAWPRVKESLVRLGYTLEGGPIRFDAGKPMARELMRLSKPAGLDEELFTVDFLLVGGPLESVWEDRDRFAWRGRQIQAVSRRGLKRMKALAGRPQDLADLSRLEEAGAEED